MDYQKKINTKYLYVNMRILDKKVRCYFISNYRLIRLERNVLKTKKQKKGGEYRIMIINNVKDIFRYSPCKLNE